MLVQILYFYSIHYILTLRLGLDNTIYQSWCSTPPFCQTCSTLLEVPQGKATQAFYDEVFCAQFAQEHNLIAVVHLDQEHRFFPTIYNWLALESDLLPQFGVYSLHNFWYLLKPTWTHLLQASSLHDKHLHISNIKTVSNTTITNIALPSSTTQQLFLEAISLVFNITISLNTIHEAKVISIKSINKCPTPNPTKTILIQTSIHNTPIIIPCIPQSRLSTTPMVQFLTFSLVLFTLF